MKNLNSRVHEVLRAHIGEVPVMLVVDLNSLFNEVLQERLRWILGHITSCNCVKVLNNAINEVSDES